MVLAEWLPSPSFCALVDTSAMDQSDPRDGALFTRVLDPKAEPRFFRLTWQDIPAATILGIREHYATYGPGGTSTLREWKFKPPGSSTEYAVSWFGSLSIRWTSNAVGTVEGVLERNLATTILQDPITGAILVDKDGNFLIEPVTGLTLSYVRAPTAPLVAP